MTDKPEFTSLYGDLLDAYLRHEKAYDDRRDRAADIASTFENALASARHTQQNDVARAEETRRQGLEEANRRSNEQLQNANVEREALFAELSMNVHSIQESSARAKSSIATHHVIETVNWSDNEPVALKTIDDLTRLTQESSVHAREIARLSEIYGPTLAEETRRKQVLLSGSFGVVAIIAVSLFVILTTQASRQANQIRTTETAAQDQLEVNSRRIIISDIMNSGEVVRNNTGLALRFCTTANLNDITMNVISFRNPGGTNPSTTTRAYNRIPIDNSGCYRVQIFSSASTGSIFEIYISLNGSIPPEIDLARQECSRGNYACFTWQP